jgi:calcineurin-like phosphoesterase family protein
MRDMWFTSDNHWGHRNIIEYCRRPFSSVEEMDEAMIERWNKVVKPGDIVYHLGDLMLGPGKTLGYRLAKLFIRLHGEIFLIRGNHDRGAKPYLEAGFEGCVKECKLYGYTTPDEGPIHLRHAPPARPRAEHQQYRMMLCGHVHERWKQKGKLVNVGVDQWDFTPVHLDTLLHITSEAHLRTV